MRYFVLVKRITVGMSAAVRVTYTRLATRTIRWDTNYHVHGTQHTLYIDTVRLYWHVDCEPRSTLLSSQLRATTAGQHRHRTRTGRHDSRSTPVDDLECTSRRRGTGEEAEHAHLDALPRLRLVRRARVVDG